MTKPIELTESEELLMSWLLNDNYRILIRRNWGVDDHDKAPEQYCISCLELLFWSPDDGAQDRHLYVFEHINNWEHYFRFHIRCVKKDVISLIEKQLDSIPWPYKDIKKLIEKELFNIYTEKFRNIQHR